MGEGQVLREPGRYPQAVVDAVITQVSANIPVDSGITIDGVDISDHAADLDAHIHDIREQMVVARYFGVPGYLGQTPYAQEAHILFAIPLVIPRNLTVDRIALNIATAVAGGLARIGIYSDSSLTPGAQLNAGGEIDCSTTGFKEVTISQALSKGLLWLAYVCNNATIAIDLMRGIFSIIGMSSTAQYPIGMLRRVFAYAALPDPWGTPDDPPSSGHYWNVVLRLLSLD